MELLILPLPLTLILNQILARFLVLILTLFLNGEYPNSWFHHQNLKVHLLMILQLITQALHLKDYHPQLTIIQVLILLQLVILVLTTVLLRFQWVIPPQLIKLSCPKLVLHHE